MEKLFLRETQQRWPWCDMPPPPTKKGMGWRPQKKTRGALGSSFSFERRLINGVPFFRGGEGFVASTDALFGFYFQRHLLSVRRRKTVATKKPPRHVGGGTLYASFAKKTVGDRERAFQVRVNMKKTLTSSRETRRW